MAYRHVVVGSSSEVEVDAAMPTRLAAAGTAQVRSGRLRLVAELLIAVNPDEDSRPSYLLLAR